MRAPDADAVPATRIGQRVLDHARHHPERVAIVGRDGQVTYGRLAEACEPGRLTREIAAPAYVGVDVDDSAESVVALLSTMMQGYAVGVLDADWPTAERAGAIAQLAPAAVLGRRPGARWERCMGDEGGRPCYRAPHDGGKPSVKDAFYVGFTSGSSGQPKAFVRTHRSWIASFDGLDRVAPLPEGSVIVPGALSSSHFLFGVLHGLHCGRTVELIGGADYARAVAHRLGDPRPVGAVYVVPSMLGRILDHVDESGRRQAPAIMCAGAHLPAPTRQLAGDVWPSARIVEYYGASELSFVAIRVDGDGSADGSVGRAFPGVEISIRDDSGHPCPPGHPGRIHVRSDLIFCGYRGDPGPTPASQIPGGWWTVGDRGHLDADGMLFVVGRGTSLIITGGANVQPEEVEEVIAAVPGVARCGVIGVPSETWGEIPVAVIEVDGDRVPDRAALREMCARRLARHKRPHRYFAVDAIPMGSAGKIQRDRLRAGVLAGRARELT